MGNRFKFRIWDKKEKQMLEVLLISYFMNGEMSSVRASNVCGDILIFDDYEQRFNDIVLMQCTGLKDKNGQLIYEGDIIADAEHKYTVEWSLNNGYFVRKPWIDQIFTYRIDIETTRNTKIIGNIYENKEFLEA